MKSPWESVTETCTRLGIKPADRCLAVHIATQTMQFFRKGELVRSYVVSTSKRPPSNLKDSLGTPRGLHAISEKIGADQPPGMVFKARVPTGGHFNELPDAGTHPNLITSRILWLRGLETGVNLGGNVDTHDRYIYIHGTNHEDRLGTPQSAGCILMANLDIIALYEEVRTGDLIWIE
jgi:L,D-transpeptidase catalytic domain